LFAQQTGGGGCRPLRPPARYAHERFCDHSRNVA
jgi:hypothetical protein